METLSVDMVSGDVKLTQQPALGKGCEEALALIGAFRLRAGTAVAVVTGAQKVGRRVSAAMVWGGRGCWQGVPAMHGTCGQHTCGYLHIAWRWNGM